VYYYRVVFREDGHFTRERPGQRVPRDSIEPNSRQQQAMADIMDALRRRDTTTETRNADGEEPAGRPPAIRKEGGDDGDPGQDVRLRHAIRNFYIFLFCQKVGSMLFQSPVLSFCAMLSRMVPPPYGEGEKRRTRRRRRRRRTSGDGRDTTCETSRGTLTATCRR
jgi:hypothetical protein